MQYALGRLPSPPDSRDHRLSLYVSELDGIIWTLPAKVKPLHSYGVLDQGQTPKCVAFSGVLGRTISEWPDVKHTVLFDPDQLYARCKQLDGDPTAEGTYPRIACEILLKEGALVTKVPKTHKLWVGTKMKIGAYARLQSLDEIRASIFQYGSAWIGSVWYDSWMDITNGILGRPDNIAGGHAYEAIGYDDSKLTPLGRGALLIQNSWGKSWGISGKGWLPYQVIDLSNQNDWEAWRTIDIIDAV